MKKILVMLALVVAMVANAQTEHLKFKGVPIDGTIESFTKQLQSKGFTTVTANSKSVLMNGDFAGYSNCDILISGVQNSNLVYQVGVVFNEHDSWHALLNNYTTLKNMLIQKYGEPALVMEEWIDTHSEGMELYFLEDCNYVTQFELVNGKIIVGISSNARVMMAYIDKINSEINDQSAIDDL